MACNGYANGCRCKACEQRSISLPRRLAVHKDVRCEIEILYRLGFVYTGPNGAGKHCFEHKSVPFLGPPKEISLSPSPKHRSWRKKHRHRLARYLGVTQPQLERMIDGKPIEPSKARREDGPGRKSNEVVVMEHAMSVGIPCDSAQATKLISRFGSTRGARKALDGMADAAAKQTAIKAAA